jgi:hypothetical protein
LLSRDFISIFHAKFRYLPPKNRYIVLCAEIFNTQKSWGPTKNFQGPPAPRGQGKFPPMPPPLGGHAPPPPPFWHRDDLVEWFDIHQLVVVCYLAILLLRCVSQTASISNWFVSSIIFTSSILFLKLQIFICPMFNLFRLNWSPV